MNVAFVVRLRSPASVAIVGRIELAAAPRVTLCGHALSINGTMASMHPVRLRNQAFQHSCQKPNLSSQSLSKMPRDERPHGMRPQLSSSRVLFSTRLLSRWYERFLHIPNSPLDYLCRSRLTLLASWLTSPILSCRMSVPPKAQRLHFGLRSCHRYRL